MAAKCERVKCSIYPFGYSRGKSCHVSIYKVKTRACVYARAYMNAYMHRYMDACIQCTRA